VGGHFHSKLGQICDPAPFVVVVLAGTSRVENSAQGSSCQLMFVHGVSNITPAFLWDRFWDKNKKSF
jgi:hypothetical protein